MPSSKDEVIYIAKNLDERLNFVENSFFIKKWLTQDLAEKIGFLTDNYSVRKSLFDLCRHYNPEWKIPQSIIDTLVNQWNKQKTDIEIFDFVGMDLDDWNS